MVLDHEDVMTQLKRQYKFRDYEFDCLDALVRPEYEESCPAVFVHGYKSVGKTLIVKQFLEQKQIPHSIVTCDQYLSQKILLQNIIVQLMQDLGKPMPEESKFVNKGTTVASIFSTCDTLASFVNNLDIYLQAVEHDKTHVVVLDRIDQFIENPHSIIAGLARLNELSPARIIILFISSLEEPIEAVTTSIPKVYFRPYTQAEIKDIFNQHKFCFFGSPQFDSSPSSQKFWQMYVQVIVDAFFPFTGSAMNILTDLCFEKWETFIEPIIEGRFSTNDFMKVYNANRDLFKSDNLMTSNVVNYDSSTREQEGTTIKLNDLTYHSKFLLIAAYLGSYIEQKNDLHFFSSIKKESTHKRKFRRKQQKSATLNSIDIKLLSPNGFDLERLYAIFLVIYKTESKYLNDDLHSSDQLRVYSDIQLAERAHEIANLSLAGNIDLAAQVAILESQGLLTRTVTRDILQTKLRWRCAVSFEDIQTIARDVDFPLVNYLTD